MLGIKAAQEAVMAMLKVIEVLAESDQSWEDAAQVAVRNASETLRGIRSIYVKEMEATVGEDGRITHYRINAKISFTIER
jgi:flavin-binding protein dodecin